MKPESKFWNNKLRPRIACGKIRGAWQRVEVKLPQGFPDCVVNLAPRTLFVELKAVFEEHELKRELRAEQALWINRWNEDGGEAYVLAFVESLGEMFWYRDTLAMRKGVFRKCPPPPGLYGTGYYGCLKRGA